MHGEYSTFYMRRAVHTRRIVQGGRIRRKKCPRSPSFDLRTAALCEQNVPRHGRFLSTTRQHMVSWSTIRNVPSFLRRPRNTFHVLTRRTYGNGGIWCKCKWQLWFFETAVISSRNSPACASLHLQLPHVPAITNASGRHERVENKTNQVSMVC